MATHRASAPLCVYRHAVVGRVVLSHTSCVRAVTECVCEQREVNGEKVETHKMVRPKVVVYALVV